MTTTVDVDERGWYTPCPACGRADGHVCKGTTAEPGLFVTYEDGRQLRPCLGTTVLADGRCGSCFQRVTSSGGCVNLVQVEEPKP